MSSNHSKINCKDLFVSTNLDLIDMNPLHKENAPLPRSPMINFFVSKKNILIQKDDIE